jgi:DNA-binding PadR family transcriptional regulator
MPFGPFAFGGFRGPWFGRGPRAARGNVRAAILLLLEEQPLHGYQLIHEIAERSGGFWRPSPGSIYPAVQGLEDEGLVRVETSGGKRIIHLTDAGIAYVEEHRDELGAPWDTVTASVNDGVVELQDLLGQVAAAAMQVAHAGTDEQCAQARTVLVNARRTLYRILAEDGDEDGADGHS